jgi:hypothetical protein
MVVQENDFAIGPISKSFFDVLLYGIDYVVFDNSVSPFPGIIENNLIDDGIVKRNKSKDELKQHFTNYLPINRDHIFNKYYPDIFSNNIPRKNREKSLFQFLN